MSSATKDVLQRGSVDDYFWITSTGHYIGTLVRICPEALLGRYLVVTSIDSGKPWLTEAQKSSGWELREGLVRSPKLEGLEKLFYQRDGNDAPGYDEWYLFKDPPGPL